MSAQLLIEEVIEMVEQNKRPGGLVIAIVLNDLKEVINAREFTDWAHVEETVRYIRSFVPVSTITKWQRKLKKGSF